jgi:hypothetical protein
MTDMPVAAAGLRSSLRAVFGRIWKDQRVWLTSALILVVLALLDPGQAAESTGFAAEALLRTAPFLVLSIGIAAWAGATGADNLIAKAFTGAPLLMIGLGALAGGISPFCSCGVIPLIAALLAMGVPLSAVMAFWLASPIMDPSMFVLTMRDARPRVCGGQDDGCHRAGPVRRDRGASDDRRRGSCRSAARGHRQRRLRRGQDPRAQARRLAVLGEWRIAAPSSPNRPGPPPCFWQAG